MAALSLDPDYLRMLVLKVRAFLGNEDAKVPEEGSNPTDDVMSSSIFQEDSDDLSHEELIEEIRGLDARQQVELVALMWLGRDEGAPEEFGDLVRLAASRREVPTENYLLDHPLVAEYGSMAWSVSASAALLKNEREAVPPFRALQELSLIHRVETRPTDAHACSR